MSAKTFLLSLACGLGSFVAAAQLPADSIPPLCVSDSLALALGDSAVIVPSEPMPVALFLPAIYMGEEKHPVSPDSLASASRLDRALASSMRARAIVKRFAITHPDRVRYNVFTLPEPPKQYVLVADPETAIMVLKEVPVPSLSVDSAAVAVVDVSKQHWLNKFGTLLQLSQGFVSPNWYQGGNNSLNLIAQFNYQSNLNTKFHPNLLFENSFQWYTTVAATQDDPYRNYSLTENRFQINSKFGYKAAHNWYYTFNGVFKTPVFNGYKVGEETRTASFLSPGELNIGLGMTYNHTNAKKTFTIGITISPLSYNLKTVIDRKIDPKMHGIEEGHRTKHDFGSSAEINWEWKICYQITWKSRIFAFTDYEYFQGDWQNQFAFNITRFLSANVQCDLRYDSSVPPVGSWKRWQLREQLSLGFSYTINH